MMLPEVPKSIVVIGAGAIGDRVRRLLERLRRRGHGHRVHAAHPARRGRRDLAGAARASSKKKGMKIHTGAKTTGVKVERQDRHHVVHRRRRQGRRPSRRSRVLLAVGVRANVEGIGLEGMGVTLDRGFIQVDDQLPHHQPRHLVDRRLRRPAAARPRRDGRGRALPSRPWPASTPSPSTTTPSPAARTAIPRSRRSARPRRRRARPGSTSTSASFPFNVNGKALGAGHIDGFVKVITNKARGEIVGVHVHRLRRDRPHRRDVARDDLRGDRRTTSWPPFTRTPRCPRSCSRPRRARSAKRSTSEARRRCAQPGRNVDARRDPLAQAARPRRRRRRRAAPTATRFAPKPDWIRLKMPSGEVFFDLQEARCASSGCTPSARARRARTSASAGTAARSPS